MPGPPDWPTATTPCWPPRRCSWRSGGGRSHGCLTTIGKIIVQPGGVNAIPSSVTAWLDARGADETGSRVAVAEIADAVEARSGTVVGGVLDLGDPVRPGVDHPAEPAARSRR